MTEENVAGVIFKEKLAFKNNVDKLNFYIWNKVEGKLCLLIYHLYKSLAILFDRHQMSHSVSVDVFSVKWNNLKMTVFPFIFDVKSYL